MKGNTAMKDRKALEKWSRERDRKTFPAYALVMIIMMCLIRLIDEFATNTFTSLQSSVINEFYVSGQGLSYEEGLSKFSLMTTACTLVSIVAIFYGILCDKIGRKITLIISVAGMALGMAVCWWSPDITTFWFGRILIIFFTAADVHQIYIMELAPSEKRATWISVSSFVSYLGLMSISLARMANTHNDVLNWRGVVTVPSIAAIVCCVFLFMFARETPAFLKERIAYLEKPAEQRKAEKEEAKRNKKAESAESGFGPAFRYVMHNRQALFCLIAGQLSWLGMMAYTFYYETIMTTGGMSTGQVNSALFVYPVTMALVSFLAGVIADKYGRKNSTIVVSVIAFIALAGFLYGAGNGWNEYIVGLLYGLEVGAYWQFGGMTGLALKESVPTRIRASVGAVSGMFGLIMNIVCMVSISIIVGFAGITPVCLVTGFIGLGIPAILFALFTKETKGTDIDALDATE